MANLTDKLKQAISAYDPSKDMKSAANGIGAIQQNIDEYKKATAPPVSSPVLASPPSPTDLVNPNARYGSRPGEQRLKLSVPVQGLAGIR